MTSEIIKPDSCYAYITVIKQTPKCALSPKLFLELLEMLTPFSDPSKYDSKNLAADWTKPCSRIGRVQTAAFVGIVTMCKLLNLSTCVLSVCCHKYWGEMELPLAPQFIILTIRSVFMTPHWKDGALPKDDLMMLNPPRLVRLSGRWANWPCSLRSSNYEYTYHSVSHAGETIGKFRSKMRRTKRTTSTPLVNRS